MWRRARRAVHGGERDERAGLRLAWLHLRVGVMNELQYRANFFVQLLQSLVAIAHRADRAGGDLRPHDDLNGWTRPSCSS